MSNIEKWLEDEIEYRQGLIDTSDNIARAFFTGQVIALKHVIEELRK